MDNSRWMEVGAQWFERKGWKPFQFQQECWQYYLEGYSGLLNAPTGSGKTFALWIPCMLEQMKLEQEHGQACGKHQLKVIWITPLRALANDIKLAMENLALEMGLSWHIAIRSGDTEVAERQKQKRSAPDCLITTPESLHLLLSHKDAANYLSHVRAIIVDEWHELLSSKRGVQMELAIARLKWLNGSQLKVWGISATIGNLEQAKDVLLGLDFSQPSIIVRAEIEKKIKIESVLPDEVDKFPWGGHLGIKLLPKVLPIINSHNTTLLFTNTRSQTEIWYHQILEYAPELSGAMAMHHGAIDNEVRSWVEQALHEGKLKVVVCTSSLDLGVDFRPVDTVIQVGGPKGVARFLQRAGRSGHQPGAVSSIYFVPTHALELVEAAALRHALSHKVFESRKPLERSFDVLVQYLVTLATGDGFRQVQVFDEIKSTYSYHSITNEEWQWVLKFITQGGEALGQYDEFYKVFEENGVYKIVSRKAAMIHRLSIGTIVGDMSMRVKYLTGGNLGTIEESFAAKLNPGEVFWFAGRNLEFVMIKEMTVLVRKANKKKGKIPTWQGGRMPLSSQLSSLIKSKLQEAAEGIYRDPELIHIKPILDLQQQWSILPANHALLIEKVQSRAGHHLFIYPFAGRSVHEVLAGLIAYRIGQMQPLSFSIAMNDYGFELLSDEPIPVEDALELDLFSIENLDDELQYAINQAEMSRRMFRDIATISGLVYKGMPSAKVSNRHLQASSGILFNVFQEYDPDNLLLHQANDEVLNLQIDRERLLQTLIDINSKQIVLKYPPKPTPFAFPIMVDGLRGKLSSEKLSDRIAKMQVELERYAAGG